MGNTFTVAGDAPCVNIQYAASTTGPFTVGGQNTIIGNTCKYGASGVLKTMNLNSADGGGDVFSDNTFYDINPLSLIGLTGT